MAGCDVCLLEASTLGARTGRRFGGQLGLYSKFRETGKGRPLRQGEGGLSSHGKKIRTKPVMVRRMRLYR